MNSDNEERIVHHPFGIRKIIALAIIYILLVSVIAIKVIQSVT
jgi:hypothetical protein